MVYVTNCFAFLCNSRRFIACDVEQKGIDAMQ